MANANLMPASLRADNELCVRTRSRCGECGGSGAAALGEPGTDPGDCQRCDGLGHRQQWTPLVAFLDLLLVAAMIETIRGELRELDAAKRPGHAPARSGTGCEP